jgi:hypothetical protein
MDTHLSGQAAQDFASALANMQALNDNGWSLDEGGDNLDALAQGYKDLDGGESFDNFTIKGYLPVYQSITPEIYGHVRYAQQGLGYDNILMRTEPGANKWQRRIALKGWDQDSKRLSPGYSIDEYPFASSEEGGFDFENNRPVSTALVRFAEQGIQAGQIGGLYSALNVGDRFVVVPLGTDAHPEPYGYPYFTFREPDGMLIPGGKRIFSPDLVPLLLPNRAPQSSPFNLLPASEGVVGTILQILEEMALKPAF